MSIAHALLRLALILPLPAFAPTPATAQESLRIHGSNTVGERLMPALIERHLREAGLRVEPWRALAPGERGLRAGALAIELHSHGSSTAFSGLREGRADIGMSSRPIQPREREALRAAGIEVEERVLAIDGLAVIVAERNPLRSLDVPTLRRIFAGQINDWSQLGQAPGRIALHARDDRSGTYESFASLVLRGTPLAGSARRYESTEELAAQVAADPRAIGFVGLSGVRGVRALAIADGGKALPPSIHDVAVEDYPLSRRLFLYVPTQASAAARALVDFALSDAGQAEVQRYGLVSQALAAFTPSPRQGASPDYLSLVQGAQRLSVNFRFDAASAGLDSKGSADLQRLAAFLRRPTLQHRELILVGFADANETTPALALMLSNDRADVVADQLEALGLRPGRVRGMGGSSPVAANDSELGRARNRRVEVWLR